jgi:DNA-directed RNA polymerase subunit H (RpoH/RPB5)
MQHTDGEHACVAHAQINIKRMLNARRIAGHDQDIVLTCDDFLWAMTRGDTYMVVFVTDINKKTLMAVAEFCRPDPEQPPRITHCIMVYRNKCTPTAAKEMQSFPDVEMEQFKMDEIVVCPLDSKMVPEYHLLDAVEAQRVRDKFGESRLPTILTTDPVQRYYHGQINDIYLVISRYGALQAEYKYRVVREPTT